MTVKFEDVLWKLLLIFEIGMVGFSFATIISYGNKVDVPAIYSCIFAYSFGTSLNIVATLAPLINKKYDKSFPHFLTFLLELFTIYAIIVVINDLNGGNEKYPDIAYLVKIYILYYGTKFLITIGVIVLVIALGCIESRQRSRKIAQSSRRIARYAEKYTKKFIYYNVHDRSGYECPICLVEYESDDEMLELSCGHLAHSKCLTRWLNQKSNCPMCRQPLLVEALDA